MNPNEFATKNNLLRIKENINISKVGYDILDKKRNVLIKEILKLNSKAKKIQEDIDEIFVQAYLALQNANIELGMSNVKDLSFTIKQENSIIVKVRSIMGVEMPIIKYDDEILKPNFGFSNTSVSLDKVIDCFAKVKKLIIELAVLENTAYKLAENIKKTKRRANALNNVIIPKNKHLMISMQNTLEERERDENNRLKAIKNFRN